MNPFSRMATTEKPIWGNLRRTHPFSTHYGFDRGTPIDRYYVAQFFDKHRAEITGNVLEIQQTGYTRMFGHDVRASHSLDVEQDHGTTFVCDLAQSEGVLASDFYDCFLLPDTLNHLFDLERCLEQALRIVKPGGVILATSATLVPTTPDFLDWWRLTPAGWREVTHHVWHDCDISVESYGNVLAATAALMGIAYEELTREELDVNDPRYPVLVSVWCRKNKRT
jgi:SAM-dependent methyltransferase